MNHSVRIVLAPSCILVKLPYLRPQVAGASRDRFREEWLSDGEPFPTLWAKGQDNLVPGQVRTAAK